jgi:hypothetical protein
MHTNLDNIQTGVNDIICDRLGLKNREILSAKKNALMKLTTFCPNEHLDEVRQALFDAGAGSIGKYDQCSFNIEGNGTFRAGEDAKPYVGSVGHLHVEKETRIELVFSYDRKVPIISALKQSHPYEEVAFYIQPLENENQYVGSGMSGELPEDMSETDFLQIMKVKLKAKIIRHTRLLNKSIRKVAVCGGSGSFLLNDAIMTGNQVFITSDFKYHQFFDADSKIVIADIGHFESEQFTMDLIKGLILKNFSTFAVRITEVNTNPVQYM